MKDFIKSELDKGDLQHAYLLCGDVANIFSELKNYFSDKRDVEVFSHTFNILGIDDVHGVSSLQKKHSENNKVFVLGAHGFTTEAQNALLKTLEEPTRNTSFFIITGTESQVLLTLRSRCRIFDVVTESNNFKIELFMKADLAKRLEILDSMTQRVEEEEDKIKRKEEVRSFLNSLELFLKSDLEKNSKALEELYMVRKYINDRPSSSKLLLEHLALVV